MAKEAEAERERRAKIVAVEDLSDIIAGSRTRRTGAAPVEAIERAAKRYGNPICRRVAPRP